jgi:carboxypeptidase T
MTKKILSIAALWLTTLSVAETGAYRLIVDDMRAIEKANPDLVSIFSIGKNEDAIPIYALRMSLTPTKVDSSKIGHLVVATHHGNERHAPILAMQLIRSLVAQYRSTDLFKGKLPVTEWVFIPVLNISGYNAGTRDEFRTDPNREYSGPCHSGAPSLASVKALVNHLTTRVYSASVTIHGYLGALTYPWGFSSTNVRTLDDNLYGKLTKQAATSNGYRVGTSTDVVYPVNGAFEDYAYWKHGMWSWLVELENGSLSDITETTDAVLTLFDGVDSSPSTHNGVTGRCTSSYSLDLHNE